MAPKSKDSRALTDVELELMTILWKRGEGTVNDVMSDLSSDRELAYTSVSTILRILEQKDILKTRKEGRGHVYIPILKKRDYERLSVKNVLEKVFEGQASQLVARLIETKGLSKTELDKLKALIEGESS